MLELPVCETFGDEVLFRTLSRLSCWILGDEGDGAPDPIANPITTLGGVVIGALLCASKPYSKMALMNV